MEQDRLSQYFTPDMCHFIQYKHFSYSLSDVYLHTLLHLNPSILIIVHLLVDVPQRLEAVTIRLRHTWRTHLLTHIWGQRLQTRVNLGSIPGHEGGIHRTTWEEYSINPSALNQVNLRRAQITILSIPHHIQSYITTHPFHIFNQPIHQSNQ